MVFGIISIGYCVKRLEIFQIPFSNKNLKQEFILLIGLGIFLFIICFINDYSKEVGKYDFYSDNFVKALSHGSISLEEKPDERLLNMKNPYDAHGRYEENIIRGEDYIWDSALYNGKYYVYFGILPAIILFLPYYLITGKLLISASAVLIFSILVAISIKALIEIIFTKFFKKLEFKYMFFSLLIMLFGSQILILNGIPRFYEVPIASGLFFAITGIDFILMFMYSEKQNYSKIFIGTLCLALSVACRPTQLLTSLIVLPMLVRVFITNVKNKKNIIKSVLAITIPYLLIGSLLMIYNYQRFGNILEFGAKYQLTITDMNHLSNRFSCLGIGIICSLFSIPNFVSNFPFVYYHNNLITFYGYYYIENMIGGLFILVPICFAIFKIPTLCKKSNNKELLKLIITFTSVGFLMCILSIMMAGSMQRYIADYAWIIILAGLCIFLEYYNIFKEKDVKNMLKKIFVYITIYTVFINFCSGIISEKSFMKNNSPDIYNKIKYSIDFWE